MMVLPANATGWFWHSLARETGRIGHLYSPGAQRGPWPWFPYALDNGAFSYWDQQANTFDNGAWHDEGLRRWRQLLFWATTVKQRPGWAIVPDVPGNADGTMHAWRQHVGETVRSGLSPAIAVQDGMTARDVRALAPAPLVVCVGGTTDWKWETAPDWCTAFPRVHVLRCNSPKRLMELEAWGAESTDGTGWNRGDRTQTEGLEEWARARATPSYDRLWPFTCRAPKDRRQLDLGGAR